jgi:hypothetical protein
VPLLYSTSFSLGKDHIMQWPTSRRTPARLRCPRTYLALVAALALSCFSNRAVAQDVPFQGAADGRDQSVTLEPGGIHIIALATGQATHVGRFTERLDYLLSYDLVNFAGVATITAANGDLLSLNFQGAIPGFASRHFPLPFTARFTVVGGTGRFQQATGAGDILGIDFGQGLFALAFEGQIR